MRRTEYAGEVERTKVRITGLVACIVDTANGGEWIDAPTRYVVLCDEHSTINDAGTITEARDLMRHPWSFCEDCRHLIPEAAGVGR